MAQSHSSFPIGVSENLKVYVYRLIDPRNGETFYVGKGRGDRVFQHAAGLTADFEGALPDKLDRVRAIRLAGLNVAHVVHRHGLDDATAFEVEAALIDAYPGLTNRQAGHGSGRGAAHAESIISRYAAEEVVFHHDVLMITINTTSMTATPYEAVRYAWKLGLRNAEKVELVLAVDRGRVVGVFRSEQWLQATTVNFPGRENRPDRIGFVGSEAEHEIQSLYLNRRIPDRFRTKGAANPVKYAWKVAKPSHKV
ncbi:LEM-3-like GIY-YIG domain-containing protein [Brevundimonas sp.]